MIRRKRLIQTLFLILAILFLWLILAFFPGGSFSATYRPGYSPLGGGKGVFGRLSPESRVQIGRGEAWLSGDPIYFSFYSARPITSLDLEIEYAAQLSADKPLIEAGVLMDKKAGNYRLKPVENYWLQLYSTWPAHRSEAGVVVLDRAGRYPDAETFFSDLAHGRLVDCPDLSACLATYRYDAVLMSEISATGQTSQAPVALAGSHEIYTVSPDGDINLSFLVRDNGAKDKEWRIEAFGLDGESLASHNYELPLDGRQAGTFQIEGLSPGQVVKLIIKADNNVIFESLSVDSSRFSFAGHLNLYGSSSGRQVYTDRPFILLEGSDPLIKGEYFFGGQSFMVDSTYKQFAFRGQGGSDYYPLILAYDKVKLANNGVFAFETGQLVNPAYARVDQYFSPDEDIRYVVADYESPQIQGERKIAKVSLDMRGAYRENNRYQLVLSLPEPFAATSSPVAVYSIKGRAKATSVWEKLSRTIRR